MLGSVSLNPENPPRTEPSALDSGESSFHLPLEGQAGKVFGALLGGALGDALGYAVEFSPAAEISAAFGPDGLRDFAALPAPVPFSDDTQMTLYTLDGLLEALEWANQGVGADETACIWLAYLRWLKTQGVALDPAAPSPPLRWIDTQAVLHHRRAPGNACLSGLSGPDMGTTFRPVNPDSKGCGTVMRSAPFGLLPYVEPEMVYRLSQDAAALTHGHPSALHSAAVFSVLIHDLLAPEASLQDAAESAVRRAGESGVPELAARLADAVALAGSGPVSPAELTAALGAGWVAEEALAIGVYAALATSGAGTPQEHFRAAVALAVNHDGDSDSTGSITGNIVGTLHGAAALPTDWLEALEGREVIEELARQFLKATTG
ncbi:ADP-ribosylglycohydrolase family protein [Arthrobacter jiangjiafuii]|uniref:ADP-ribosylglycohydrolase family protein n=1 Tax=Arthrobacter jiangjiafuii TaxID=2817475 RepID=A0A975M3F0_9MICC|nr:ADP-ribosylglycohydrolase family protein [Arthrobacter jiangjiafuii]QWC09172.1 ADP-ribosylglycohydrolase family protein [Arthrobacter jiangjiafuii]